MSYNLDINVSGNSPRLFQGYYGGFVKFNSFNLKIYFYMFAYFLMIQLNLNYKNILNWVNLFIDINSLY